MILNSLRFFLAFILFAFCLHLQAQFNKEEILSKIQKISAPEEKLDSICKYNEVIFHQGFFDDAYNLSLEGQKLAEQQNNSSAKADMNILIARYYNRQDRAAESIALIKSVIRENSDYYQNAKEYVLGILSLCYNQNNQLDSAIYYNLLADEMLIREKKPQRAKGLIHRMDIYLKQGLVDRALEAGDLAYYTNESVKDTVGHLWLLYRLAEANLIYNNVDNYAKYAKEYTEYSESRKSNYHQGIFDFEYENLDDYIEKIELVAENYKASNFARGVHLTNYKLIDLYIEKENYTKAYKKLLDVEATINENNFENSIVENLETKYMLERKLGFDSKALVTTDQLNILRDSFQRQESRQIILELETKYETRQKEQEIKLLNSENALKDLTILKSNLFKWIFAICALVLGIFTYFLFKNNKQKKQYNEVLESKNEIINKSLLEKEDLLREIHHRVKNNLQIISSLLRLQSRTITDPETREVLQEGQNRVQSMALIHQNLYKTDNLTGVELKGYFEKLCNNLLQTYNIGTESIDLKLDVEPLILDVSTLIPLGLIVNELFTNSLKYAFEMVEHPTIYLSLIQKEKQLFLKVSDNGNGVSDEMVEYLSNPEELRNKDWGFGTRLIKTFAKKLNASISANNKGGTTLEMVINDYELAKSKV